MPAGAPWLAMEWAGGGTLAGNTAGQTSWSRGYSQITHGNILAGYWGPNVRNERIRIDGLTL